MQKISRIITSGTTKLSPYELFLDIDSSGGQVIIELPSYKAMFDSYLKRGNGFGFSYKFRDIGKKAKENNIIFNPPNGAKINGNDFMAINVNGMCGIIEMCGEDTWLLNTFTNDLLLAELANTINGHIENDEIVIKSGKFSRLESEGEETQTITTIKKPKLVFFTVNANIDENTIRGSKGIDDGVNASCITSSLNNTSIVASDTENSINISDGINGYIAKITNITDTGFELTWTVPLGGIGFNIDISWYAITE